MEDSLAKICELWTSPREIPETPIFFCLVVGVIVDVNNTIVIWLSWDTSTYSQIEVGAFSIPPQKKNGKDSFTKSCCYHPTLTIFSLRHVIFLWRVSGLQWSSCWTKSWIDIFHAHIRSSVHRLFNVRNLRRQPPSCFFEAQSKHGHESVVVIIYIFANL